MVRCRQAQVVKTQAWEFSSPLSGGDDYHFSLPHPRSTSAIFARHRRQRHTRHTVGGFAALLSECLATWFGRWWLVFASCWKACWARQACPPGRFSRTGAMPSAGPQTQQIWKSRQAARSAHWLFPLRGRDVCFGHLVVFTAESARVGSPASRGTASAFTVKQIKSILKSLELSTIGVKAFVGKSDHSYRH
jgi:hypothetical protein